VSDNVAQFVAKCQHAGILTSVNKRHAGTIHYLAMTGVLQPVEFIAFDGVRRRAVCMLVAEDFLKELGQYDQKKGSHPYCSFEQDIPVRYRS
jgi:hypothetical protein